MIPTFALATMVTLAGLIDDPYGPNAKPIELPCNLQIPPDRERCPTAYRHFLKALERRQPRNRIHELEDRIERLERELEELRR